MRSPNHDCAPCCLRLIKTEQRPLIPVSWECLEMNE